MLPGLTTALFGGAKPVTFGVDVNTKSLMKFDGYWGAPMRGAALTDYVKRTRMWSSGGDTNASQAMRYGGSCVYMDGSATSGIFSPASDPDFDLVGDFTIDFWVVPGNPTVDNLVLLSKSPASNYSPFLFYQTTSKLTFYSSSNGAAWDIAGGLQFGAATSAVWTHLAVQRKGNVWTGYYNGTQAWTFTSALNPMVTTAQVGVGIYATSKLAMFNGYFDELRFSNVARYSGNFTPQYFPYFPALNGSNDAATRLLLHGENMNDSAAGGYCLGPHSVYIGGTAMTSNQNKKFGGKSFYFDGSTGCYVWVPASLCTDLHPRDGDWTVDFWYYRVSGSGQVAGIRSDTSQYSPLLIMDTGAGFVFYGSSTNTSWDVFSAADLGAIPTGQWVHFALVHSNALPDATAVRSFVNGVLTKQYNYTKNTFLLQVLNHFCIGGCSNQAGPVCYVDELRFSSVARWTSSFTPPSAPYGPDTPTTRLLLHMDGVNGGGAFPDSSPEPHIAVFVANLTTSTNTAKFGATSAIFNGSNGYMACHYSPDWDLGAGDFTIDYWEYRTNSADARAAVARDGSQPYSGFLLGYAVSGNLNCYFSSNNTSWDVAGPVSMGPIVLNEWHHFAVVRKDNVITTYRDGQLIAQFRTTLPLAASTGNLNLGFYTNNYFGGYIDEFRIVKGAAMWTSSFTPPSAPYTGTEAVAYEDDPTVLLLHMDGANNGAIFQDSSRYNKSMVRQNSYVTTTNYKKFGNSSAGMNAVGDCVYVNSPGGDPDFAFGTADFTIDFWANPVNAPSVAGDFFDFRPPSTNGFYPVVYMETVGTINLFLNSTIRITSTTRMAANTWMHIALVRASGITKLYINGVQEGVSYTDSNNYPNVANRPVIGNDSFVTANPFQGVIDEFRVSRVARWTSNFTPPLVAYGATLGAPAAKFTVTGPSTIQVNTAFNITVQARDAANNPTNNYTGTIHFTSTNGTATLPADSTISNGVGTFSVTLRAGGNFTVTATDTVTSSITGTSGNVNVTTGPATPQLLAWGASTTWTVPADWTSNNSIACIGGGGNGSQNGDATGAGGGGGAYAQTNSVALTPGEVLTIRIDGPAGYTLVQRQSNGQTLCQAAPGGNASGASPGAGGDIAASVGTVRYYGGAGAGGLGGGGGAAGPYGQGGGGGPGDSYYSAGGGGGGGGGAGGGAGGGGVGGAGGNSYAWGGGGAGGSATGGGTGVNGGGGGGAGYTGGTSSGGNGGNGPDFGQANLGSGGGGGGAPADFGGGNAGHGGFYGGGGGGGYYTVGAGRTGLIVIRYQ